MRKKFAIAILFWVVITVFFVHTFKMTGNDITVKLNGQELNFDVQPIIVDGRTLVPFRNIFESFGVAVNWEESTQTVFGLKGNKVIALQINNLNASVNGQMVILDVPAKLIDGRTMVPIRFVAEALDAAVDWDASTSTIYINTKTEGAYQVITPEQAKEKLEKKENVFLIDVRTQEEYEQVHIKESILVPLDELENKIESVVPDKNSDIIVYCRSGNRTKIATQQLLSMGYMNIFDLGGIIDWPYEVEK